MSDQERAVALYNSCAHKNLPEMFEDIEQAFQRIEREAAAVEREACAKVADDRRERAERLADPRELRKGVHSHTDPGEALYQGSYYAAREIADAIRSRSERDK